MIKKSKANGVILHNQKNVFCSLIFGHQNYKEVRFILGSILIKGNQSAGICFSDYIFPF